MSDYKVPYTKILNIQPHGNAERLEVATIYGFQVIIPKNQYQVGSEIIYIPIDSILPENLETLIFGPDSKIKLHNHRVRQIRIRGLASQGMVVNPSEISKLVNLTGVNLETDLSAILGVTKYEPPVPGFAQTQGKDKQRNRKSENPLFHHYNGLDNIKWFPDLFQEGESVTVQEKLHGTNARASILPFVANSFWKKVKKFLRIASATENCYGSNNVEISAKTNYKGFYGIDLYGTTFNKMDVFSKIKFGETVFGEIIGPSIQKNYVYGLSEPKFVLFDVKILCPDGTQMWLCPDAVAEFAKERGFEMVPIIYRGPYNKEFVQSLTKGASVYDPNTKVREGIVIKSNDGYDREGNKRALKSISEDYLADPTNTDNH